MEWIKIFSCLWKSVSWHHAWLNNKTPDWGKFLFFYDLNFRLKYSNYEYFEMNHPSPVKKEHLEKGMIILSASEMSCFVNNFRYFVGDLVPVHNQVWSLYLLLLEITDILSNSEVNSSYKEHMKTIITQYLKTLLLFPNINLKPKHIVALSIYFA